MDTRINAGRTTIACALAAVLCSTVHAVWPDDPAVNLVVSDASGPQVQPKVVPTSDGGCYISWFGGSGYDVYLQRLDAAGNALWPDGGILIADRGFSSTQDYDLDVDASDSALLAFRDDRPGGTQITATKVSPAGTQVWGDTGVQLTATTDFVAAPKHAATTDGSSVVAWKNEDVVILQKLDTNGDPLWGEGVIISHASNSFSASDLDPSNDGGVIISLVLGFFGPTYYAQKLDTNGTVLWGADPIAIFDGGTIQIGNFPQFVTDGSGGAVFSWYGVSPLQCYVQRVLADGTEAFAHNGVTVSTDVMRARVNPDAVFNAETSEIFVFWREQNSMQSQDGVYGQKIAADGSRQWTSSGRQLVAVSPEQRTQVRAQLMGDGAIVFYVEGSSFADQTIRAGRVNTDGDLVWTPGFSDVSIASGGKSRLAVTTSTSGYAIGAWSDSRDDEGDLYAQNVNADGTLGVTELPGDVDGDGDVDVEDLLLLLAAWGTADPDADIDGNGIVDVQDLLLLLANWT
jgi:hypothetical protein